MLCTPLYPMVNDHYPYYMAIIGNNWIYPIFRQTHIRDNWYLYRGARARIAQDMCKCDVVNPKWTIPYWHLLIRWRWREIPYWPPNFAILVESKKRDSGLGHWADHDLSEVHISRRLQAFWLNPAWADTLTWPQKIRSVCRTLNLDSDPPHCLGWKAGMIRGAISFRIKQLFWHVFAAPSLQNTPASCWLFEPKPWCSESHQDANVANKLYQRMSVHGSSCWSTGHCNHCCEQSNLRTGVVCRCAHGRLKNHLLLYNNELQVIYIYIDFIYIYTHTYTHVHVVWIYLIPPHMGKWGAKSWP